MERRTKAVRLIMRNLTFVILKLNTDVLWPLLARNGGRTQAVALLALFVKYSDLRGKEHEV